MPWCVFQIQVPSARNQNTWKFLRHWCYWLSYASKTPLCKPRLAMVMHMHSWTYTWTKIHLKVAVQQHSTFLAFIYSLRKYWIQKLGHVHSQDIIGHSNKNINWKTNWITWTEKKMLLTYHISHSSLSI